jgi:hypothetical protein
LPHRLLRSPGESLIERNRAYGAPIRHHYSVAAAQDAGSGRIEFPVNSVETRKAMGDLQIENLGRHFSGKPILSGVV